MTTYIEDFAELMADERDYQAMKYAEGSVEQLNRTDDVMNNPENFTAFIAHHASRWFPGGFPPHTKETIQTFQKQMVKVATLAYAGYTWAERRLERMN